MNKIILTATFILIVLSPIAQAQPPDADLRDEMEIMEAILGRLMMQNTDMTGLNSDARGFYIKGYGVIFNVAYPLHGKISMIINSAKNPGTPGSPKIATRIDQVTVPDEEDLKKDVTPEAKKAISVFFSKYASSITGLKPDEKITVIVDLKGSFFIPSLPSPQKEKSPFQIIATLSMKDLLDMKKNNVTPDQLEKQVAFNEIDAIDQETAIFTNVIQTALEQVKAGAEYSFLGNVKSLYIKGHGILFMVDSDIGLTKAVSVFTKKLSKTDSSSGVIVSTDQKGTQDIFGGNITINAEDYKEYEEKLVKVISKYGHTLTKVKPDEYVEIALNCKSMGRNKENSRGIIRVKKADIDDLNSGKLDFENFRKRVNTIYY